ncbi:MAG: FAD-dependent oxidoreductase [Gammaproteobacteria bacterium]
MKVVVLGAGIAGITTAWHLAAGGAEVTVLDHGAEPASATSHANGGHISTQSGVPWTGPEGLRHFFATRLARERAVRILHARDPGRWRWFMRALAASRPAAYRDASESILRLARLSREVLDSLIAEQNLDVSLEADGVLTLYRTERAFRYARAHKSEAARVLSTDEALALEPALGAAAVKPVGALYYPGDATGDCRAFCCGLAERAADAGVHFRYDVEVRDPVVEQGHCRGVVTDKETLAADACVVALGAWSATFLRGCGIRVPVLPLRGYTLSAPLASDASAPGRLVDIERHMVCARLGGQFRAAGMADFAGLNLAAPRARIAQLEHVTAEWYPSLAGAAIEHWSCLRPITPDGPPILGASGMPGLWLNVGLGPLGWTLGCGAGRIVGDLVLGRTPPIPLAGLTRERFR